MTRFALRFVRERIPERPEGYYEDCVSRGRIVGEEIEFEDDVYQELLAKYSGGFIRFTLAQKLSNFVGTVGRWAAAGAPVVSKAELAWRGAICMACPHWRAEEAFPRCEICGCGDLKHELQTAVCPIGKWAVQEGCGEGAAGPQNR